MCLGKNVFTRRKNKWNVPNTFRCLLVNPLNGMTQGIYAGELRQQSFDGAPYRLAPSVSPQWQSSHTKLDNSKAEPYQRNCPLGAPLNVLIGIAYCRIGCILHVLWHFISVSPFHEFMFSLLHCRCMLSPNWNSLAINNPLTTGRKQALICGWGSLTLFANLF